MPGHIRSWEIIVASFVGGAFLCLADILFNKVPVTTRIAQYLGRHLSAGFDSSVFELFAFVVLILLGVGLCFVNQPKTRRGAFTQGSSVIFVLTSMNIGSTLIGAAIGQTLELGSTAEIATIAPRSYGPLGIGTALTGRSVADEQTIQLKAPATLNCDSVLNIGKDTFCIVEFEQLAPNLVDGSAVSNVAADKDVWIRNTPAMKN